MMPVDNYCVLYIPDIKRAVVTVIRVMYREKNIVFLRIQQKTAGHHVERENPHT